MPPEILNMLPAVGIVIGLGAWISYSRFNRKPCPTCRRRSERVLTSHKLGPDRLRPQALVYQCRHCGSSLRYARGATGQEYWQPIDHPDF